MQFAQEVLWYQDRPTDDPQPKTDPRLGDVTDGSVDSYDFEWGEPVCSCENEPLPLPVCGITRASHVVGETNTPSQKDQGEYELIEE